MSLRIPVDYHQLERMIAQGRGSGIECTFAAIRKPLLEAESLYTALEYYPDADQRDVIIEKIVKARD